jgi:hypothetical protein
VDLHHYLKNYVGKVSFILFFFSLFFFLDITRKKSAMKIFQFVLLMNSLFFFVGSFGVELIRNVISDFFGDLLSIIQNANGDVIKFAGGLIF